MLRRPVCALVMSLLLAACGPTDAQFDQRLREIAGTDERGLLGAMGRIPDSSYPLDDTTKVLQWRWDTSYVSPGMPPMYQRIGPGLWIPVGGIPPAVVREGCIVEWTVSAGIAQRYRWQGNGCRSVVLIATPPP
ncbi:MAG: hypothetical protein U1E23_14380 [Reyranellaceae bacterium]